jgi:predicted dehydrogenase
MVQVTVGIVGLGEVAQIIHLPILRALAPRYRIGAICDVSPGLLEAVGDEYGVARRYTDAHELAAQPALDAVFILDSDEYHAEHAIAALEHGKHVLVEKPMCLTMREADEIIAARDASGKQVMVAYMRRFAPAFVEAAAAVKKLPKINYVRVRDIIGANRLIIEQSSVVKRFDDIPPDLQADRRERAARLVREAIGEAPPELVGSYRLLLGLSSHDLSAMRELIGSPRRVVAASHWNGGRFIAAIFAYDGFNAVFETGVDEQRRFDAHIEVYGPTKSLRVQYDTPYIRHLPTTLVVNETEGDAFRQTTLRPTFTDPYTRELEYFHDVATKGIAPKTPPEDFKQDLRLFRDIIDAIRAGSPAAVA